MFFSTSPIKGLKRIRIITLILSLLGIALSGYSVYVHYKKGADKNYNAFCDISDDISCSKVFTSRWGKGFGFLSALLGEDSPLILSNGVYGIIFYALVIVLGELTSLTAAKIQRIIVVATNLMSVYLGYILFFVLKDKCVVCISIYLINFLIAVSCFLRVNYLSSLKSKKKGSGGNKTANKNAPQQNANKKEQKKGGNQNAPNKNAQNVTKNEQNKNQVSNKNTQNENKKSKQQKNTENVSNKNVQNAQSKPVQTTQNKHVQNPQKQVSTTKSQQSSNKNTHNANKGSSNKSNANSNKHSKKKN